MASPFSIFRKNQKMMLALLTLLAMFGFVFIPIIMEGMGGRTIENPVVVETSQFGELREAKLSQMLQQKRKVLGALGAILQSAGIPPGIAQQWLESRLGAPTEESVVEVWLKANRARQLGMVVSDQSINAFLKGLTQDRVRADRILAVIKQSGFSSDLAFFDALRDELAAMQLDAMFRVSLAGITPAQRWDYFRRVKQMAEIEAAAVPVAQYIDRVEAPTDAKLAAFFEEHKENLPRPDSSEPGFRQPQKAALQWFKADFEKFASPEAVTDAEVQQRYEKDRKRYDPPAEEKKEKENPEASTKDAKDTKEEEGKKEEGKKEEVKDEKKEEPAAESKSALNDAVKSRIRREIAYERIQKIFSELRQEMDQHRRQWSKYEVALIQERNKPKAAQQSPAPPAKLDFGRLAEAHGLSTGSTELIPQWEMQSIEIGASLAGGRDPVWHYAYQGLANLRPEESMDLQGNLYLFWKTDEAKERTPKLDEPGVKDRVLEQWKLIKARPLALEAAKTLAAEAQKAGKPMKQAFADRTDVRVVAPPAFSWITFGSVPLGSAPQAARLSEVEGVDRAGEAFMETVFRQLEPGEAGAALNAPQTAAYAIRLIAFSPTRDVLWKQFEVDDFSKYAPAAEADQRRIMQAWLDELKTTSGLKWNRKADRIHPSPSEE